MDGVCTLCPICCMKSWRRDTMKESRAFKGPYNF